MSTRTSRTIEMRPADRADQAFMEQLFASTRSADQRMDACDARTEALLMALQFRSRQAQLHMLHPYAEVAIIAECERPIGALHVHYGSDEIRILDFSLLPASRNRGIGLGLLRSLQAQGVRMRVPVRLEVLPGSRAQRLFQRCGFTLNGANGLYLCMEWQPPLLT
ncbi:acetyltransferase (GNAT) family protein [Pseudoduganella lurida]|uniref:Acetyltransferase (GNAT) family protein n=1 Tax=Pseudoduganella lurida TaxID=1036180 RepID=A0A562RD55_9BURK|nr:GNAT family N-acetyltransferase [Pseudoduganella lurida]TWI66350.1 acetyltransferase (GNAT) family protein [Pseudoduganella lurida]